MSKVVLEIEDHHHANTRYQSFDQERIHIGRGFDNDVIINDSFIDAHHAVLNIKAEGWECVDCGSLNGTFIRTSSDARENIGVNQSKSIQSGDTIEIGKTTIKVWSSGHLVDPAHKINPKALNYSFDHRHTVKNLLIVLSVFFIFFYVVLSLSWQRMQISFFQIFTGEILILVVLAIWSGLWALITRFSKKRNRFLRHFTFACQYAIVFSAIDILLDYLGFYVCNYTFTLIGSLCIFAVMAIFVLYVHLAISTNLSSRKRLIIPSVLIFILLLLSILSFNSASKQFDPNPRHYVNMLSLPRQIIPMSSIDQTINRIDTVFEK